MRRELPRRNPHPHAFRPRGEPLDEIEPAASHPIHSGGGEIYSPTGWAPMLQELLKSSPPPHTPPPRGNPWPYLGQRSSTPHTRGRRDVLPNWLGARSHRRSLPTRMISHLGGNPWRNLGCSPRTPYPIWGDPWKHLAHRGRYGETVLCVERSIKSIFRIGGHCTSTGALRRRPQRT